MADQTLDPWKRVQQQVAMETYEQGGTARVMSAIDAARDAERQQHQQTIQQLQNDLREAIAIGRQQVQHTETALRAAYERDETIQQQAAQIETLTKERDTENRLRLQEVEHWVTRFNEVERWRVSTRRRADTAEAQIETLRQALEESLALNINVPEGVVLAARSYFERYSEATGHRFEIGELLRWQDSFYAGARWARRNPAADVGGPQSQTMAVSPPPASGDVEKLLAEKDRQIETLTQALHTARGYVVERVNKGNGPFDGLPRPGFVDYDLMLVDKALAGTSRPTEGEQGAKHVD